MSAEATQDDFEDFGGVGFEIAPVDDEPTTKGISRDRIEAQLSAMGLTAEQIAASYSFWNAQDELADPVSCQYDPELWFSQSLNDREYAKTHCERCPVIDACRRYADALNVTVGIWGGESRTSHSHPKGQS